MSEVKRSHDHPNPGPVIVVHFRHADQPLGEDNPAHAFGPYVSESMARAFEALHGGDDQCERIILDCYLPDPEDLLLTMLAEGNVTKERDDA